MAHKEMDAQQAQINKRERERQRNIRTFRQQAGLNQVPTPPPEAVNGKDPFLAGFYGIGKDGKPKCY